MCSVSRSPAPVVGFEDSQRFRKDLATSCVAFATAISCRSSDLCPRESFLSQTASLVLGGALAKTTIRAAAGQGGASPSGVSRPLRRAGGISRRTTERPGKRPNSPVPASLRPPTVPPRDTRGRVVEVKPCLTGSFFAELLDETGPVIGNHKATVRLPGRRSVPTAGTRAARSRGHVVEGCRRIEPARFG